jgi:hypothetical protein
MADGTLLATTYRSQINMKTADDKYEVLHPWADAPVHPLKGLSSRLGDLERKKIGFLINAKRTARPILTVVERKLQETILNLETSWYDASKHTQLGTHVGTEGESEDRPGFKEWVQGVDAVIGAIGD